MNGWFKIIWTTIYIYIYISTLYTMFGKLENEWKGHGERTVLFFLAWELEGEKHWGGGGEVSHAPLPFFIWEVIDLQLFLTSVTLIWRKWYKSILSSTFFAKKEEEEIITLFPSIFTPSKVQKKVEEMLVSLPHFIPCLHPSPPPFLCCSFFFQT
jgi:hypothetical protein